MMDEAKGILTICAGGAAGTATAIAGSALAGLAAPIAIGLGLAVALGSVMVAAAMDE